MRNRYTRNKNKGTHRLHNAPERDVYPRFVETMQLKVIETEKIEEDAFIRKLAKEPWEMTGGELYEKLQKHIDKITEGISIEE